MLERNNWQLSNYQLAIGSWQLSIVNGITVYDVTVHSKFEGVCLTIAVLATGAWVRGARPAVLSSDSGDPVDPLDPPRIPQNLFWSNTPLWHIYLGNDSKTAMGGSGKLFLRKNIAGDKIPPETTAFTKQTNEKTTHRRQDTTGDQDFNNTNTLVSEKKRSTGCKIPPETRTCTKRHHFQKNDAPEPRYHRRPGLP
jgi:hypothetical protein